MSTPTESEFVRGRVAALGLRAHPEGGWYREVYRSAATLPLPRGSRSLMTTIDFVLPPGAHSTWHVVRSDECWVWHAGDPLELHQLDDAGHHARVRLGPDFAGGEVASCVVPAGVWQAARPVGAVGAHVCCVVAPGFDFADFRVADARALAAAHPEHEALIATFCRV